MSAVIESRDPAKACGSEMICGYRSSVRVSCEALHPPPAPLKRSFEQTAHSIRTGSFSAWISANLGIFLPIHAVRFPLGKFHLSFADWTF